MEHGAGIRDQHTISCILFRVLLLLLLFTGGLFAMKEAKEADIVSIRKYLKDNDYYRAEEIPVEVIELKNPTKWMKGYSLYLVHIGAFSEKDPIPSPMYIHLNENKQLVFWAQRYFTEHKIDINTQEDAIELTRMIININYPDTMRVIKDSKGLYPGFIPSLENRFHESYMALGTALRGSLPGPEVEKTPEGWKITCHVFLDEWDTMHRQMHRLDHLQVYIVTVVKGKIEIKDLGMAD